MAASLATPQTSVGVRARGAASNRAERAIRFYAEIAAERKQVQYALTLPEYLETWLMPCDASYRHERLVTRVGTGYLMEYRNLQGQLTIIDGVFRTTDPGRVVFTWSRRWPRKTRRSLVTFDLYEDGGSAVLVLTHSGVMNDLEHCWLHDTWNVSLARLKLLFEPGRNTAFDAPAAPAARYLS